MLANQDPMEAIYSNVQGTMVARKLDEAVLTLMNSCVNISKMLYELQLTHYNMTPEISTMQNVIQQSYGKSVQLRATAQKILAGETVYSLVFEHENGN